LTTQPPFLDTNIFVYAYGSSGAKAEVAERLIATEAVISVQILNEFAAVMHGKFKLDIAKVRLRVDELLVDCPDPKPLTLETHRAALRLCERFGFSIYDGTLIVSALEAGCKVLYTEDLQHGQVIDGLRIENPFLD